MKTFVYVAYYKPNKKKSYHLALVFSQAILIALVNGCLVPNISPCRTSFCNRLSVSVPLSLSHCKPPLSSEVTYLESQEINHAGSRSTSSNETKNKKLLGAAFFYRLEELRRYMVENNGSCMVPRRLGSLGIWVNKTRAQYQKHLKGEKSSLTAARISALNEIGFVWVATGQNGRSPTKAALWNARFEEMRKFQELHGHCNVPSNYAVSPHLQSWMYTQKLHYRKRRDGKYSLLTIERIEALNSIGFSWDESRWDQLWHQNFEQLRQYKAQHGNCAVPISYPNKQLACWVSRQRQEYKRLKEGKASSISNQRQKLLEGIGFVWSMVEKEASF
jgi:hypothetical protein